MKKILFALLTFSLIQALPAYSERVNSGGGGGDRGGDRGGGWGGGNGGSNGGGGGNSSSGGSVDTTDHTTTTHARGNSSSSSRTYSGRNGRNYGTNRNGNGGNYGANRYGNNRGNYSGTPSNRNGNRGTWNNNYTGRTYNGHNGNNGSAPFVRGNNGQAKGLAQDHQHSFNNFPTRGPGGKAIRGSMVSPQAMGSVRVRTQMNGFAHNSSFRAQVNAFNFRENRPGQYYWHNWNGNNFCHFYDRWGCNWYGWYGGSGFFWTQYWGGNWWWCDPYWDRWCYWNNGWCWASPYNTTVYVYENGNYVPSDQAYANTNAPPDNGNNAPSNNADNSNYQNNYDNNGDIASVKSGDTNPGGVNGPSGGGMNAGASEAADVNFPSADGTRDVKIMGADGDAILTDTSGKKAFKPVFLGSHVKEVKYSRPNNGALKILVILEDGTFETFNADGIQQKGGGN